MGGVGGRGGDGGLDVVGPLPTPAFPAGTRGPLRLQRGHGRSETHDHFPCPQRRTAGGDLQITVKASLARVGGVDYRRALQDE
jgi:hypothetical protein